jgi:hypothetical protein
MERASSIGDLAHGIGDFLDDLSQGVDIDLAGVRIDAAAQFFVGFEVFTGGDNDSRLQSHGPRSAGRFLFPG